MLSELSIRNVVLIDALDIEFSAGLTALTGETGAGKSIILDALGMATGSRSDRGVVRSGTDKAQCSATFVISDDNPLQAVLEDAEISVDNGELVLRRTVNSDGRSRAFINDTPVSVKFLSLVGAQLMEVHGQHDGRGLLNPSAHLGMLDTFGGLERLVAQCSGAYRSRSEAQATLKSLIAAHEKSVSEREFLADSIAELDRLDPRAGEDAALVSRRKFLQGAEGALAELNTAETILGEEGAFEDNLARSMDGIDRVLDKIGDANPQIVSVLENAVQALEKAILETQEARSAVADAAACFDIEPGELDKTERRLFALKAAARKFEVEVDALPALRLKFAQDLEQMDAFDQNIEAARRAADLAERNFTDIADKLSTARRQAGAALATAVKTELPPLKMENADFQVSIESTDPGPAGHDKIRFLVSTNPGTAIGPLEKIASGGELARFALAIKVALSARNNSVMVFDEVDQGVGGAVAAAVGRRLAKLSQGAQVFVVTHSPQVAAVASHQFLIKKTSSGAATTTHVTPIELDAREEEIARMLAGEQVTPEARAAARQLMRAS